MTVEIPTIRPGAAVRGLADDLTVAVDEDGVRPVIGWLPTRILSLVNGRRSVVEIAERLEPEITVVEVAVEVAELVKAGVLCDARAVKLDPSAGVLPPQNRRPRVAIASSSVVMASAGVDRKTVAQFCACLTTLGVRVVAPADGARLRVVLTADYLADRLTLINRRALKSGESWLIVRPLGKRPWVGPLFEPTVGSPCWECLAMRLRETFRLGAYLSRHYPHVSAPRLTLVPDPRAIDAAAHLSAAWCRRFARRSARPAVPRAGGLWTIDGPNNDSRWHTVVRRPDCPACGRSYRQPSQRRTRTASEAGGPLPASLRRHISPITGVVGTVSSRWPLNSTAHLAVAEHVFGPEIEDVDSLWRDCRRIAAGGGETDRAARRSAICEAIERYSGVHRTTDVSRLTTFDALGDTAVHPNDVMGFSRAQFANRASWNRANPDAYARVPEPFRSRQVRGWTMLRSLLSGKERWLPTALCYFGVQPQREQSDCLADSNGCASGETLDDAIVRGFLEAVERDAVGIWWHNRLQRPGVALRTVPDSFVQSVVQLYRRMRRDLRVLDVTTDLNVPAFAALSSDGGTVARRLTVGFGAHFDPRLALRRAIIELNLFVPEIARGRRRALFGGAAPSGSYLQPIETVPWMVVMNSLGRYHRTDRQSGALGQVTTVARRHGLEVLVLDQTRPDVGVPVARVVVPGFCHFWPRRAPQRLYRVPVALGWRTRPTHELELNRSRILL